MNAVVRQPSVTSPKVSVVLLDWSVRESLHSLKYLNHQTVPRDNYELIWIEYYNSRPPQLVEMSRMQGPVRLDQWIVLDMPAACYYHKHMYITR